MEARIKQKERTEQTVGEGLVRPETCTKMKETKSLYLWIAKPKSQGREDQLKIIGFETCLVLMENKVEGVVAELKGLMSHRLYESRNDDLDARIEEVRREYRSHFAENFTKLLTALESLERQVNLTKLICNAAFCIPGGQRHAQSTPKDLSLSVGIRDDGHALYAKGMRNEVGKRMQSGRAKKRRRKNLSSGNRNLTGNLHVKHSWRSLKLLLV